MAVSFNGVTLCDDESDAVDGHRDLRISAQDSFQIDNVMRSVNAFGRGRGNRVYTVSFSSTKRHASVAAAVTYCGVHPVQTGGTASFTGFSLSLNNAVCAADVQHVGVTTIAQYTITGTKTPTEII